MSFHTSPRLLLTVPVLVFLGLTLLIAVIPAIQLNAEFPPASEAAPAPGTDAWDVARGREIYVREGCVACHTQQVRSDTRLPPGEDGRPRPLAEDSRYGRASSPEDYAAERAPLMGSERVGPDLCNVGSRLPSREWHLLHLYSPRAVSPASVMPPYPWYFRGKDDHEEGRDVRVPLTDVEKARIEPDEKKRREVELWATPEAQQLVKYLLSLKQTP